MTEKKIIYTLYKHTFPNGKVYIGITKMEPEKRWANGEGYAHKENDKYCQSLMYNAIKKYGWENVKHEIILQSDSRDFIEQQEIYYIKLIL